MTPQELRAQAAALEARAVELETPLTEADVSRMFKAREYDAIAQAQADGRLDTMLGVPPEDTALLAKVHNGEALDAGDVAALARLGRHEEITIARERGQLDTMLAHNHEGV